MDKALIDAPNLYSQMAPYAVFGAKWGRVARTMGMFGSEMSSLTDAGVPFAAALPLGTVSIYQTLQPAINSFDGKELSFVTSAFKKIRSHSADPRIMQAVPSLRKLFERAVPLYSEAPREGDRAMVVAWHTYAAKIGEGEYIRLTAWETRKGELKLDFHDLTLSDSLKEKGGQSLSAERVSNPERSKDSRLSKDTIPQWMDFVKALPETFHQDQSAQPSAAPSTFMAEARGEITFHDGVTLMRLFRGKADFSTILPIGLEQKGSKGYFVNFAFSAYGRKFDDTRIPNNQWFVKQAEMGMLLYRNMKKSRDWMRTAGLQLPGVGASDRGNATIRNETDLVKLKEKNPNYYPGLTHLIFR